MGTANGYISELPVQFDLQSSPRNNLIHGNGMNKKNLFVGTFIGFAGTFIGSYLYLSFFTNFEFNEGLPFFKAQGSLGKLISRIHFEFNHIWIL
jgi:hypothetical protein